VPSDCTVRSGQGTNSISLNIPSTFVNGSISVAGSNTCGAGNIITDSISTRPVRPSEITGLSQLTPGQTGLVYSTLTDPDIINYYWTVPTNATIVSGQRTNSIIVNWGFSSGHVKVKASECADSSGQGLWVKVKEASGEISLLKQNNSAQQDNSKFMLLPNPARDKVTVLFSADNNRNYAIELTDVAGKILLNRKGLSSKGENNNTLDVSNYAKGMYFINLIDENGKQSLKLSKQ
jgi:hypothetical protein